jgi:hypothetical protein
MPAPSVRSKIAGVGSFRDFASKHKQQIAVLTAKIAVPTTALALVIWVSVETWQPGEHITKTAVEDLGQFWACAKAPDLSHISDIEAAVRGDIEAAKDVRDVAKDVGDQFSSCMKAVKRVGKTLEAEFRLPEIEKEGGKVLKEGGKVFEWAEEHTDAE